MDNATDGVILMSMGSLLKGSSVPENTKENFLAAFRKIRQKVIFKYEDEEGLYDKPDNVKILNWVPQKELLCKLYFILNSNNYQNYFDKLMC